MIPVKKDKRVNRMKASCEFMWNPMRVEEELGGTERSPEPGGSGFGGKSVRGTNLLLFDLGGLAQHIFTCVLFIFPAGLLYLLWDGLQMFLEHFHFTIIQVISWVWRSFLNQFQQESRQFSDIPDDFKPSVTPQQFCHLPFKWFNWHVQIVVVLYFNFNFQHWRCNIHNI